MPQPRTYLRDRLEAIQALAREGQDKAVLALWCAAFAEAPEDDPEMLIMARQAEMCLIWAAMVLALREMPREVRQQWLSKRTTRYWLRKLAHEADDHFGASAEIWMEWRQISREMDGVEHG
jgi:hypothetical protein